MILVLFMAFWKQKVTDKVTPQLSEWLELTGDVGSIPTNLPTMGHNAQQTYCTISHMEIIGKVKTSADGNLSWCWLAVSPNINWETRGHISSLSLLRLHCLIWWMLGSILAQKPKIISRLRATDDNLNIYRRHFKFHLVSMVISVRFLSSNYLYNKLLAGK